MLHHHQLETLLALLISGILVKTDKELDQRLVNEIISGSRPRFHLSHTSKRLILLVYPSGNASQSNTDDTYVFELPFTSLDPAALHLYLNAATKVKLKWPRFATRLTSSKHSSVAIHDAKHDYMLLCTEQTTDLKQSRHLLFNLNTAQTHDLVIQMPDDNQCHQMVSSNDSGTFYLIKHNQLNRYRLDSAEGKLLPEATGVQKSPELYLCRDGPLQVDIQTYACPMAIAPPVLMTGFIDTNSHLYLFDWNATVYVSQSVLKDSSKNRLHQIPLAEFFIADTPPNGPSLWIILLVIFLIVVLLISIASIYWNNNQKRPKKGKKRKKKKRKQKKPSLSDDDTRTNQKVPRNASSTQQLTKTGSDQSVEQQSQPHMGTIKLPRLVLKG